MNEWIRKFHCGDALTILKQMPDEFVDMIITSPPYPGNNKMWGDLYNEKNIEKAHEYLNQVWNECLRILKPGCKMAINIANTKRRPYIPNTFYIYKWAIDKIEPLGEIIWNKGYGQCGTAWGSFRPCDPSLADQHEYILIFRKFGNRHKQKNYKIPAFQFKSWRNSMWNISPEKAKKIGHIAPFPEKIPARLITLYSYPNEIICDPFCGSGTVAYSAKELGRQWLGIDNNFKYIELAEKRMEQGVLF